MRWPDGRCGLVAGKETPQQDLLTTISKLVRIWKASVVQESSGGESPTGGKRRPGRPAKITDSASSAAAALGGLSCGGCGSIAG